MSIKCRLGYTKRWYTKKIPGSFLPDKIIPVSLSKPQYFCILVLRNTYGTEYGYNLILTPKQTSDERSIKNWPLHFPRNFSLPSFNGYHYCLTTILFARAKKPMTYAAFPCALITDRPENVVLVLM